MGMVVPVLPTLIEQVGGVKGTQTIVIFGVFGTVWAVMQLFSSPVQGALSDRFGRRPVILISNFGMGANYLLMAIAPNLAWLFVGRIISGICAGSIPAAMAYLADINPPEKRAASFGLLGAAFSLGFSIGPAMGGLLGNAWGPRAPFWAAAALSLLNFLYGVFVLPESLPRDRRAPISFWRLNPVGALYGLWRSYPAMGGMLVVAFLLALAQQGPNNVFVLYTRERYHWSPGQIGLLMTGFGVGGMIVQAGLIGPAIKRLGERGSMLVGGVLQMTGLTLFGLARTGTQFWAALPVSSVAAIGGPAWSSIMSRAVGPSEQGRLAGATASLSSIGAIVGPVLFTQSFAIAETKGSILPPGTPFFLAAGFLAAGIGLAAWVTRRTAPIVGA